MNIWLDDIRPAPEGYIQARSVNEAIRLMHGGVVTLLSLDHDLGDFAEDGGDGIKLVLWMAETDTWPTFRPTVHSMNPVGRRNMEALINRYGPYGED